MDNSNLSEQALEYVFERFEKFLNTVDKLCEGKNEKVRNLLDNQDVCQLLNISKRKLYYMRANGEISYLKIGGKVFYESSLIHELMESMKVKKQ